MIRRKVSSIIFVLGLSVPLVAQRDVHRDAAALAVLEEAIGPRKQATALIRDSLADGQIRMASGQSGTIRITTQGSKRIRYEIALPDRRYDSVLKDGKGYRMVGKEKKDLPLWVSAYHSVEHIPMLSRILDYANGDIKLIDLGVSKFAGRDCREIRIAVQPIEEEMIRIEDLMSELHVFVDTQTKEIAGTRGFVFSPEAIENRSPVDRVFSDYRLVDGIPIPFRVDQYISGRPDQVLTWTSVRLNVGIGNNVFD